jgi:hypothetical protein
VRRLTPWLFLPAVLSAAASVAAGPAEFTSTHFTFHYTPIDAAGIAATAAGVERRYEHIVGDLAVSDMPRVHVTLYTDHAALEAATRARAGTVPSWAYGLVTAEDQIHCMSPHQPGWGPHERRVGDIVHEFAHAVTLHLNANFANNPRWLWESVAIYEAGQRVDPRELSELAAYRPLSLAALNELSDKRIYQVGYSISEFIVSRWGRAKLRELVIHQGDTRAVLGVSLAAFESQWLAFVAKKGPSQDGSRGRLKLGTS